MEQLGTKLFWNRQKKGCGRSHVENAVFPFSKTVCANNSKTHRHTSDERFRMFRKCLSRAIASLHKHLGGQNDRFPDKGTVQCTFVAHAYRTARARAASVIPTQEICLSLMVVEIDETSLAKKRKHGRGAANDTQWAIGMIDRNDDFCLIDHTVHCTLHKTQKVPSTTSTPRFIPTSLFPLCPQTKTKIILYWEVLVPSSAKQDEGNSHAYYSK